MHDQNKGLQRQKRSAEDNRNVLQQRRVQWMMQEKKQHKHREQFKKKENTLNPDSTPGL